MFTWKSQADVRTTPAFLTTQKEKKWPLTLWKTVCQFLKKLHTHQPGDSAISLLVIYTREGNGNPLQCSCLENPRDGGAWWAAVHGVAQSRTRRKRLSSSSSSNFRIRNSNVRPKMYTQMLTAVLSVISKDGSNPDVHQHWMNTEIVLHPHYGILLRIKGSELFRQQHRWNSKQLC